MTIARDAVVNYATPFMAEGNTSASAEFLQNMLGPKWYWAPEIDLISLPGCVFATKHSLAIFKNFLVCDELDYRSDTRSIPDYFEPGDRGLHLNEYMRARVRDAPWGAESTLLLHPRFHRNYTHWHTEGLSQLDTLRALSSVIGVIGVPSLEGFKRPSFELFGDVGRPVVELDAPVYRFSVALMLTHSLFRTWLHPATVPAMRRLRNAARERNQQHRGVRHPVYLSRQDSKFRPVINEIDVCRALADRGFEVVVASDLTFEEQTRTFGEASMIVSPHGSGLTNMIYAQPGTRIIELRPMHANGRSPFYDRSYWILATLLGLEYGMLIFENSHDADEWEVDIPWLLSKIDSISLD